MVLGYVAVVTIDIILQEPISVKRQTGCGAESRTSEVQISSCHNEEGAEHPLNQVVFMEETQDQGFVGESDYAALFDAGVRGSFLPGTSIEIIREPAGRGGYKHVLFDFDGTLSLVREGWPEVMVEMMVEILLQTPCHEPKEELQDVVRDYVARLTGKQTIYQMIRLAQEVAKRGSAPEEPSYYKRVYHDALMERIRSRREDLKSGRVSRRICWSRTLSNC